MSNYFCVKLQSPEVLLGKTISARERRHGVSRRRKRCRGNPEDWITLKKLVHIMLVALSTMTVTSVMVVMLKKVMTYPVTCQFTGTWRIHLEELPQTAFVLSLFRISDFYYKYLHIWFFIFLSYFFLIHGHPPHFKRYVLMWVFYWVSDNSISWICVKF